MPLLPDFGIEIREGRGNVYRWVIQAGIDGKIAITDDAFGTHKSLARAEEICAPSDDCPTVFDGGSLYFKPQLNSYFIPQNITNSTQPEGLSGLDKLSSGYITQAIKMRRMSAQRIADAIGIPLLAEMYNGTIEQFNPSS